MFDVFLFPISNLVFNRGKEAKMYNIKFQLLRSQKVDISIWYRWRWNFRSSRRRCSFKNGALRNFANSQENTASLYFNKVAVSKFLITSFLQSTSKRLLLKLTEFTKSNVRSWRVWKSWSSHWLIKVRCFTSLYRCPLSNKYCRRGHFFNKQAEYCESVSILKGS